MKEKLSLASILFGPPVEGLVELLPTQGAIPTSLRGTYYLNGPANFRRGDFTYAHWLDGDGLIRAVRFAGGRATHFSRFVRSRKYQDEQAAGRPLYRAFGTVFPGDRLRRRIALESPVNVSIYQFEQHLFSFGEQCLPWELSPETLETKGECNFYGLFPEISPFSAHPKIDHDARRLCNFGLKFGLKGNKLTYWEFDAKLKLVFETEFAVEFPYSVHDFALSARFAAFYLSPYLLELAPFLRQGRSLFDALAWHPEMRNELLLTERIPQGKKWHIPMGRRGYCLHLINGFDDGETMAIDLIETEEPLYSQYRPLPELFSTVKPCTIVRLRIDVRSGTVLEVLEAPQVVHLDFPALLPESYGKPYQKAWILGMPTEPVNATKYYDRILCFDWDQRAIVDQYLPPSGIYLSGEPSLVRGGSSEPEVILICPRWHAAENRSDYVLLDALALSSPPIAVLPLPHPSPLAFHSSFEADPAVSSLPKRAFSP